MALPETGGGADTLSMAEAARHLRIDPAELLALLIPDGFTLLSLISLAIVLRILSRLFH